MVALERSMSTVDPDNGPDADDTEVLDAYSHAVSSVAEKLIPSVASLRVNRSMGGWAAGGRPGLGGEDREKYLSIIFGCAR